MIRKQNETWKRSEVSRRDRESKPEERADDASGARRPSAVDKARKEEEEDKRRSGRASEYVKDDGSGKPRGHTNSRAKRTEKVGSQGMPGDWEGWQNSALCARRVRRQSL